MNPFTAAVAGGALTVGNKRPRRSTGQNGQHRNRGGENDKNEDHQHQCKMQDETVEQKSEKRDVRDCTIL